MSAKTTKELEDEKAIATKAINDLRNRLIRATFKISEQCSTALRGVVDQYAKHMNLTMFRNADSEFPISTKAHPHHPERTQFEIKGSVLCFHVGNAVLGLYHAAQTGHTSPLRERVEFLEHVGAKNFCNFEVAGSDSEGFYLAEKTKEPPKFSETSIVPD